MEISNDLKQKIQEYFKMPGRVRGSSIKAMQEYVEKQYGRDKSKAIETILFESGCPIKIGELKPMEWYPLGVMPAHYLVIQAVLGWNEKQFEQAGKQIAKLSLIERLIGRYFLSASKIYKMGPDVYRRHFDTGSLETPDINFFKKYFIIKIKNIKTNPLHCAVLRGWFLTMASFVIQTKNSSCQETKCVFRGDPYHEFKIYWK